MTDNPPGAPLAAARRSHILGALAADGIVRASQLTNALGVTPVTVRRDLAQLEGEGLLTRVRGGAIPRGRAGGPAGSPPLGASGVVGGSLAVLVPSLDYYWPGVLRGMEEEARRRGVTLIPRGASYELNDERPMLERLAATDGVRGLLVAPNPDTPHAREVIDWLDQCGLPTVLLEREASFARTGQPVESVSTDHGLGAALAARHLADLGHQHVGLLLSRHSPTSRKIAVGWRTACTALGLTSALSGERLLPDRSTPDFGAIVGTALDEMLAEGVTGLLVHSDPEAMAIVDLALTRGASVPEELSIVAYDDEIAQLFSPALTAISPPRAAVGRAAVDLLLARIEDPARPAHRILLSPQLTLRETTAPARA